MAQIRENNEFYEVHGLVTSDGDLVTAQNPLPVTLGSDSITITGDVNVSSDVHVNNPVDDPAYVALAPGGVANSATNPVYVQGTADTSFFAPTQTDAFGRLRTSSPFTLFDSTHRYKDNNLWSTATTGTASANFDANGCLINMTVDGNANAEVVRETTKVFSYQPGKSLLILNTFTMEAAKANLRQRVGYYGAQNGIYLEQDGTTINLVKRTYVSGSMQETRVAKSSWNINTLGSLDLSKSQIFWIDVEWLGVGSVRCGFVIDGEFVHVHTFHHANIITGTYMSTASLPLRYEIKNTGSTGSSSTLKQICSSVMSEGGYELRGLQQAASTTIGSPKALTTANTDYVVMSLRLKSTNLDAIVVPSALSILGTTNNTVYRWKLLQAATTTAGSWSNVSSDSAVEYNTTATGVSGGRIVASGFAVGSNQGSTGISILKSAVLNLQLERNGLTGTASEFTLVVAADTNSATVNASIDWEEVTR
ncbi:hypothetical protein EBV26_08785 [bacterium]|nr:hypothetical protein [bacterium]